MDEFKQSGGGLRGLLEATEMYSAKHYSRVDRNLKRTFYVQYVLSQMTLLDNSNKPGGEEEGSGSPEKKESKSSDRKRDKKARGKKEARVSEKITSSLDKKSQKSKRKSG